MMSLRSQQLLRAANASLRGQLSFLNELFDARQSSISLERWRVASQCRYSTVSPTSSPPDTPADMKQRQSKTYDSTNEVVPTRPNDPISEDSSKISKQAEDMSDNNYFHPTRSLSDENTYDRRSDSSELHSNEGMLSKLKLPTILLAVFYGAYLTWTLYCSKYNLLKAKLRIELQHRQLWYWLWFGTNIEDKAAKNSQFESGLSSELTYQIAVYFLQLDLDKANGVRRSDLVALLKECGINDPEKIPPVRQFIENGKGRSFETKRRSGCQLQEVIELFENLFLSNDKSWYSKSDDKELLNVMESLQNRLLEELKKQTKTVTKTVIPPKLQIETSSNPVASKIEENEASEEEMLQLDLNRLKTTQKSFIETQSRTGLSQAQMERLVSLEKEILTIENELLCKKQQDQIKEVKNKLNNNK